MSNETAGKSLMIQGRIVWSSGKSLFQGQPKVNMTSKQPEIDKKTGLQVITYGFGLAIPKIDPRTGQYTQQWTELYQALMSEALSLYPSGHLPAGFALKFKDGDVDRDDQGRLYSEREGYAGHVVLACTTQIPIKWFRFEGGNNILVNDGFKVGDYVNTQLTIKAHPAIGQGKPGLYVNPTAVQLIQAGKEIINTPSGDQMFGTAAPVYAGEVVAPVMGAMPSMGAPAMPQQQQYAPQAPQMPQQPAYAPQAPAAPAMPPMQQPQQAPVNPHYGVLPQQLQPQMPQQQYAPQAPQMPQQQQYAAPQMPAMPQQQVQQQHYQMPAMPQR